ncbi:site-specific integrase [Streptomyces sp. NPDC059215]|uniref:site-specific integrase n=1 Tax=Streptomyces sp. NPDC059215 TaxID=3346772 RepID=UPI003691566A
MEEGLRESNPVGRCRYTPGRQRGGQQRGLVPRLTKLTWIPGEQQWLGILQVAREESVRNRVMLALAYDSALRREELYSLRTDDLDPAHRTLRVRAETTKNRLERVVPYSVPTGALMSAYLAHRATISRARGPLFLSESRRNHGQPLILWTWSKVVRRIALEAGVPRFSTHTTRHLCLTDLAPMGWELHAIGTFAGHRNTDSTLRYIHLSSRDLADKLARSMEHIHVANTDAHLRGRHDGGGAAVTAPLQAIAAGGRAGRWSWPISPPEGNTAAAVRPAEARAVADLNVRLVRRLQYRDPSAPGWARDRAAAEAARGGQRRTGLPAHPAPPTGHAGCGRGAADAVRGDRPDRTFWGWTEEEWIHLLGRTQAESRRHAPAWAGDEVRSYLAAHAYLLGSFDEFHRLGSFQRLTLAWRIFGRDRVNAEVARLRSILSAWGYQLG